MTFALTNVAGWHLKVLCVPTALCAITGMAVEEIVKLLVKAANARGCAVAADASAAFNINDWLAVVRDVGGSWKEIEDYSSLDYRLRETISEYISRPPRPTLRLVFGENREVTMTHVFAIAGSQLVDTYTAGDVIAVNPTSVPASYNEFRIKRVFYVS